MKVKGLAAIDQRTVAARHLLDWRRDRLDDLGGDAAISAAQRTLVDVAIRTRLYLVDAADIEAVGRAHREAFGTARPATTGIVTSLIDPRWRVEIEAEAAIVGGG